jgi:hypothetical protein
MAKEVKKAAKKEVEFDGITAYCVKTKEKNVPMLDAVIDITKGRYIAKGVDADGNKMTAIMSGDNAKAQIKLKNASKGQGWT